MELRMTVEDGNPYSLVNRIKIVKMSSITESDLQIQCNPYQSFNEIIDINEETILTLLWKFKKIPTS
jgi:hypothetical protein